MFDLDETLVRVQRDEFTNCHHDQKVLVVDQNVLVPKDFGEMGPSEYYVS